MRIQQLTHILKAAKVLTNETVFILDCSQAILAQYLSPPEELALSKGALSTLP